MSAANCLRDAILADNPDLYWPADEPSTSTATDESVNGNDGTYSNIDSELRSGPACGCDPNTAHVWHADQPSKLSIDPNPLLSPTGPGYSVAFEIWFLAFDTLHNNSDTVSIYANVTRDQVVRPTHNATPDPGTATPFFLRRHPDGSYEWSLGGIPQVTAAGLVTLGEWHQWGYQRGTIPTGGFPPATEGGGEWFDGAYGTSWGGGSPLDFNGGGNDYWGTAGPAGTIEAGSGDPEAEPFDGLIAHVAWWWNGGGPDLAHHWSLRCMRRWSIGAILVG